MSNDRKTALKIAVIYLVFSVAWILFSDRILVLLVSDPLWINRLQTLKGWAFVVATSVLIYLLLQREFRLLMGVRQQLKQSEAKYRMVVESSPDLLYRTDLQGRIIFVSPSVMALSGYTEAEAVGMKMAEEVYLVPDERQTFLELMQKNGRVKNFEARLKRKDGSIWWAATNAQFFRDENGDIAGVEGITRDVTRKKDAEQALESSEQRLRAILEANPDPMVMYDLNGHPLFLNPAFTQVFGWEFDELRGRTIPFVPEDQAELSAEKIREIFKKGEPLSFETRRKTKDHRILDIILSAAVIKDATDTIYGMVVNLTDISERKILEAQYEQAQKMEALGTLAGGIAHDFNNYLSGIFGFMELARKHNRQEKVGRYLTKALESSDRARSLTHQLLTFSKGGSPVREIAPLDPFLKETALFALSGSKVSCEFDVPADLWSCNYDRNQISQVIDNIVINALHAMPDGGTVTLSAKNEVMDRDAGDNTLDPGPYVCISIADTGTGIAPEHLDRIFDPFFSTKQTGSGLGLATSYSIVNRHDGKIQVTSGVGEGTCVAVYLPATGQVMAEPETPVPLDYQGTGDVLIMDDEPVIREMLGQMLTDLGFSVHAAGHGDELLEMFQQMRDRGSPPDAVILDLTVPGGMGGRETVSRLREMDENVPVFVASGYSEDAAVASPATFGFTDSIEKPFLMDTLAGMLKTHLG
ncbi:MAG: PAS domain S-box protein [Desulfobacterales bacterium]|nr:PAS domain S-box protein [Desulfobacterales bacterium]